MVITIRKKGCVEIKTIYKGICDGIISLARSLGIKVDSYKKGDVYVCNLSYCSALDEILSKCSVESNQRIAPEKLDFSNQKFYFNVEKKSQGLEEYFGIEIEGDSKLFLLANNSVVHNCGTIQLDFNLPERFELQYSTDESTSEKMSRPVMIHRAIYGSLERFMAIISEQYGGKWPFWLSPRQIIIIPISEKYDEYAKQVYQFFFDNDYYVDLDESNNQIGKKIREAQIEQYNYIFVVGAKEHENKTVNLRIREDGDKIHGEKSWDEMLNLFKKLTKEFK